jgi:hypothetical protein
MFEIRVISSPIELSELQNVAETQFGNMVKAVVDIEKRIMAIGGELHVDEEAMMLDLGSKQVNLWGINIYPEQNGEDRVEFDSMINLRPYLGNRSRNVEDMTVQGQIIEIVNELIKE